MKTNQGITVVGITILLAALAFAHCRKVSGHEGIAAKKNAGLDAMLIGMEEAWSGAALRRDGSVLDSLLSPDFLGHHADGKVLGKREEIDGILSGPVKYDSVGLEDVKVHPLGRILAVVTGGVRWAGRNPDGKTFRHRSRWTNVWLKKEGRWQCIVGHRFPVTG
jgi:ketosteroid isomerase-like protein